MTARGCACSTIAGTSRASPACPTTPCPVCRSHRWDGVTATTRAGGARRPRPRRLSPRPATPRPSTTTGWRSNGSADEPVPLLCDQDSPHRLIHPLAGDVAPPDRPEDGRIGGLLVAGGTGDGQHVGAGPERLDRGVGERVGGGDRGVRKVVGDRDPLEP